MEFLISYGPAILIIVGTIFTTILTKKYRQLIKDKQDKIINLTDEVKDKSDFNQNLNERILGLSEEIKNVSKDNQKLTKKNLLLSEETIKLSNKISNQQTGGNSYCYLRARFQGFPENMREIYVMHEGDFTLRNVQIELIDQYKRNILYKNNRQKLDELTEIISSKSNSKEERKVASDSFGNLFTLLDGASTKVYKLGDITPNTATVLDNIILEKGQNEVYWIVTIMADNGSFRQRIKFVNILGKSSQASEVTDSKGNLLKEMTNDDFPRNDDGTIKWNND